jgi:glycosyltransferase involved in cell wall biosynthesis
VSTRKLADLPRVLVVAHYASEQRGGEGSIPLRLFGRLRSRGVEARLVTHEVARSELSALLPAAELERVTFVSSLPGFGPVFRAGRRLPTALRTLTWGVTQLERQQAMVPVVRRLVREHGIDVVHQPISVSPVIPSPMTRLGAPVIMGPLNGGMDLPPAFRDRDSLAYRATKGVRPGFAAVAHRCWRGRLDAAVLLVANPRTARLLPGPARRRAEILPDIGVVLDDWQFHPEPEGEPVRFLFLGRLVRLKGVDLLLEAFAAIADRTDAVLEVAGEGVERSRLAAQARQLGIADRVRFHGWLTPAEATRLIRQCQVFVSPALQEAGGVAVLEAMATGRPVIAAAWGGTADTVTPETGMLLDVSSPAGFIRQLGEAMLRLAGDPAVRRELGLAGRRRVEQRYAWDVLTDRLLEIYQRAAAGRLGDRALDQERETSRG